MEKTKNISNFIPRILPPILFFSLVLLCSCGQPDQRAQAQPNQLYEDALPDESHNATNPDSDKNSFVPDYTLGNENIRGNSTINICNKGVMAAQDGWVYFSVSSLSHTIYKCPIDAITPSNVITVITLRENCEYLNVVGDWIYFFLSNSGEICKVRTDGSLLQTVANNVTHVNGFMVYADKIYCTREYQVSSSESDMYFEILSAETGEILFTSPAPLWFKFVESDRVYASDSRAENVYSFALDGSDCRLLDGDSLNEFHSIWSINSRGRLQIGNSIFVDGGYLDGYSKYIHKLYRTDLNGNNQVEINSDGARVMISINDGYLYYEPQHGSSSWCRVREDGTGWEDLSWMLTGGK